MRRYRRQRDHAHAQAVVDCVARRTRTKEFFKRRGRRDAEKMPGVKPLRLCSANHKNVRTTRRIFGPRITQITRMRADHSRHSGDSRVTFPSLSFRRFVAPLLVAAPPRWVSAFSLLRARSQVALGTALWSELKRSGEANRRLPRRGSDGGRWQFHFAWRGCLRAREMRTTRRRPSRGQRGCLRQARSQSQLGADPQNVRTARRILARESRE
ncbi:hypothetical protein CfE428DRAFT_6453 [Chthoniobacter flavus Ellin428]|uniref:Uncharacterized protein n=1 Tax=Chthoniobacter flavus Ellin428 TaxID=497964 RepID=B4DC12_9BACT|nr:hypothetical protein CfE428DRAFT_6453 [Chthoniobacter flavus Ellin428]